MGSGSIGQAASLLNPVSAAVGLTGGLFKKNLDDAKNARRAQENLESQRRAELSDQAAAREAAKAKAATSGQRVGTRTSFLANIGFGTGSTSQGLGSGNLFGGSSLFGN